ncbi:MAG: haloacid dehalogenase [Chloroflexi bacterium]|nr:haloacid dehalogenase [Chloroflexota bacterium]MBU1748843.1 haloacid dehalogenase [Chloroflexota bacterium]
MNNLDAIAERIRHDMTTKTAAREEALQFSREAIQHCAHSIRAAHRGEFDDARDRLGQARDRVGHMAENLAPFPDVYYAGYVQDAQKEYTEAAAFYAILHGDPLPTPEDLGVDGAPYLNGLGETVGELRRYALDQIRRGDVARAENVLEWMQDVYEVLVTIDFPDAVTRGLRRTTDVTRGILEKTRGDLTVAARQEQLEQALRDFESRVRDER